jgi:hypothetical protein
MNKILRALAAQRGQNEESAHTSSFLALLRHLHVDVACIRPTVTIRLALIRATCVAHEVIVGCDRFEYTAWDPCRIFWNRAKAKKAQISWQAMC